ncbi:MAG: hypothetical protein RR706_03395 [Muribaculaceae bacterium]
MITNKLKTILLVIVATVTITFTSCDIDNPIPYDPPAIIGTWELAYDNIGPIDPGSAYVTKFAFYFDGTGSFGFFNKLGFWENSPFSWNLPYGGYVSMTYNDGYVEREYYRFVNGYLEISATSSFYKYTGYRSVPRSTK